MSSRGAREVRQGGRRFDPDRRSRIIDACLDVIAERGVAGTSHRRVAAAADVPLGSMTYHFDGMGELLQVAFARFADSIADRFDTRLGAAHNQAEARASVEAIITRDVFGSQRDLILTQELYTLAARDPAFREVTNAWMARSRTALTRHFDPETTVLLDALIEGLTLHAALNTAPPNRELVRRAIDRITTAQEAR
ncbi:TetR/AcrR family transcriptional regulator [Brevibacterium salitolerans]|uniref:TetR family transcriptional regulator n=1 Tax=Brevibacterium salitolerans TaxID=1403566 RepID=A0ABN2WCX6_9MICO